MINFRMPWFLTLILLILTFHNFSDAKHNSTHRSAVVVGTVYCDTCFQQDFRKTSHLISGALVAVKCGGTSSNPAFHEEVKTNEHGEFRVHLPFPVSKHVKRIKGCSVNLISSSEPYCSIASTSTTSSSLHLKSRTRGAHIFSAGFFTFKPLNEPTLCDQIPSTHNSKEVNSGEFSTPSPGIPNLSPATIDSLETSEQSNGAVEQKYTFPPFPFQLFPPPSSMVPPSPSGCTTNTPPPPQPPPYMQPPSSFQPPPSSCTTNTPPPPQPILPPNQAQPPPSMQPPSPSVVPPNPMQPPPTSLQPPPTVCPMNPSQPPP